MGFEKAVHLDAGQPQDLAQLRFRDPSGLQLFESEGFERPAREIAPALGQLGGDRVRYLQSHFHKTTLPGSVPRVNRLAKHNMLEGEDANDGAGLLAGGACAGEICVMKAEG